jgi:hypothetical protein
VWTHLDNEGGFDVLHMSDVRYVAREGIPAKIAKVRMQHQVTLCWIYKR